MYMYVYIYSGTPLLILYTHNLSTQFAPFPSFSKVAIGNELERQLSKKRRRSPSFLFFYFTFFSTKLDAQYDTTINLPHIHCIVLSWPSATSWSASSRKRRRHSLSFLLYFLIQYIYTYIFVLGASFQYYIQYTQAAHNTHSLSFLFKGGHWQRTRAPPLQKGEDALQASFFFTFCHLTRLSICYNHIN